ncbi:sulfotransferase [Salinibacter ruber]|uniref:sulfotransferase n=1 Tax=Salinibacter ruber TaxID=146919 RepID=UPI002169B38A|nr:sulfotransferase [Salinibacter ruber]MCS4058438.1 hypothetical protein [Salinibacter ruber]
MPSKSDEDQGDDAGDIKSKPQYFFVLSPPFSGSTVLHDLLATSTKVSTLPKEGQHLEEAAKYMRGSHWKPEHKVPWKKIKKIWNNAWQGDGPIFLEKSPPNLLRAEELRNTFKPASFVIMIRNPYAFAEGIRRRRNNIGIVRGAKLWVRIAEYQKQNIENLKRKIFFKYNFLCTHTEKVIKRLSTFDSRLDDLDPTKVVGWSSNRREIGIRNMNVIQVRRLSSRDVSRINNVLRERADLMEFFGYKFVFPSIARTVDSFQARVESRILSAVRFREWAPEPFERKIEQYVYRDLEVADGV